MHTKSERTWFINVQNWKNSVHKWQNKWHKWQKNKPTQTSISVFFHEIMQVGVSPLNNNCVKLNNWTLSPLHVLTTCQRSGSIKTFARQGSKKFWLSCSSVTLHSSWCSEATRSMPLERWMTSSPAPACSHRAWSSGKCWQATHLFL